MISENKPTAASFKLRIKAAEGGGRIFNIYVMLYILIK